MEPDEAETAADAARRASPEVVAALVENQRRFLAFLERRLGRRELAEEVLQDAFVRGLSHADAVRDESSAVAWFYRVLRNALNDHHRRQATRERLIEAARLEPVHAADDEMMNEVCACALSLIDTLKPECAHALRAMEFGGMTLQTYAESVGISFSNAGVRLHRARAALRKQVLRSCGACTLHGCVDCACKHEPCVG